MKKSFSLTLLLLAVFQLYAQITIVADDIAPVGVVAEQTIDDMPDASINEGANGNINWDFSALADGVATTFAFLNPSETPYDASFPVANLASSVDNEFYAYMIMDDQKIEIIGIEGELNFQGQIFQGKLDISPGQSLIRFPATYGESYNETITQTAQITGAEAQFPAFDSVRLVRTIVRSVEIDAYGTMTIPTGDFETIRSSETETTTIKIFTLFNGDWSLFQTLPAETLINFNWWAKENGFGFPVVQLEYNPSNGSRQVKWLKQFITSTNDAFQLSFALFPNPSAEYIRIDFPNEITGKIKIVNLNGQIIQVSKIQHSLSEILNTSELNAGTYYLIVSNENDKLIGLKQFSVIR